MAKTKTDLRRYWRIPADLWRKVTNIKGTRHTLPYARFICTLAMIAIAVAAVLCLQAVTRMARPMMAVAFNNPAIAEYESAVDPSPQWVDATSGKPFPRLAPLKPQEQLRATREVQKERARICAEVVLMRRRAALDDFIEAACVLVVILPLFWFHWRLLRSTPGEGQFDSEGRGW